MSPPHVIRNRDTAFSHHPSQALKALREQLNIQTRSLGPKSRFEFSPESKQAFISATNRSAAAAAGAAADDSDSDVAVQAETTDALGSLPDLAGSSGGGGGATASKARDYNAEMASEPGSAIRKPSFSRSREIDISGHRAMHIILPPTARRATSSGSVTGLRGCVLDMSMGGGGAGTPFANLVVRDVAGSLVVAGRVAGAAHVTGVRDSVLVLNARQVRMHECANVTVYLWCGSHPIIEDCRGVRFAPLPGRYLAEGQDAGGGGGGGGNQWDQVDDFNWLKAEASPNWERLPEGDPAVPEDFWTETVQGGPSLGTEDILRKAGI